MKRMPAVAAVTALLCAPTLAAQTTGPSFNAPYRAFVRSEFGATLAFPEGGGTMLEGQYRFGHRTFDIGFRGGLHFVDAPADDQVVLGVEARNRVLTHSVQFPLDGAVIFGGGLNIDGGTVWTFPIGLSLGRRVTLEGSDVSIVPYVQPTGWLITGDVLNTDFFIGVGFGADFRLSSLFDGRLSFGVGDGFEGVSISAVWVH